MSCALTVLALARGVRPGALIAAALLALAAALLALAAPSLAVAATPAGAEGRRVYAELVSEQRAIAPGASFWVALRQRIAPGWHTYWRNPGDSGEPATLEWTLPPGFEAGPIAWPQPERISAGPAMSYGYSGEVLLLTRIIAPADLPPGRPITLRAQAGWLVCEKICIPEEASLALTLPVATGGVAADPRWAGDFARTRRALPEPSPWPATVSATPETVTLEVAARGLARERIAEVWFYPHDWGVIDHAAPQEAAVTGDGITLRVARGALTTSGPVEGVLVISERLDGGTARQAFALRASPPGAGGGVLSVLGAIGLALAGGLVLNLMPCVLPVLSVKVLSLAHQAGGSRASMLRHGLAYAAGVLVGFAAIAGVLLALRAAGEQIGWGFQLQSPVFVVLLAYLLFALGLSLSGLLPIGGRLAGLGGGVAAAPGARGSLLAGALAAVVATPCTAPFMGVAVGFALTQPAPVALLVFQALGLGLALPYLALSVFPGWLRWMPRPGAWMERLQQLLAFPLYATVAWLIWVLSQQGGSRSVGAALTGLILIAFAAWLAEASRSARSLSRRLARGVALASLVIAVGLSQLPAGSSVPAGAQAESGPSWEPFTPERLAALRGEGKPVFVNVTAAWCITCLVNERVALRSPEVKAAFADRGVAYLKADWTRRDARITEMLAAFGRSGVPLYVLYPSGPPAASASAPTVLPQILTEGLVLEALGRL
ncbi:MAG: thioredoxin family protein [Candidatus Rokubacteria bacterium]|nr:thioredoxin family protein [Candidatus Rokubacteria bacterium]